MERTLSDHLVAITAAFRSPPSVSKTALDHSGSLGSHSRKSSMSHAAPSPERAGGSVGTFIRKSRSTQSSMSQQDDVECSLALSRTSSASFGLPFLFTGFTLPAGEMEDLKMFSDDPEDLEVGTQILKFRAEPTLPIYLKFTDVSYKVVLEGRKARSEKEGILNGITGVANPGEVLALMGPSGSGKTTLLSLLGGRFQAKSSIVGGSITYNDQVYTKSLKSRVGFVTQDDVLFPHLTVKETLTYAALLRLPKTMPKVEKEKTALDVICDLGLDRCQDTMIGGQFVRGVSGGERKRVCIGIEILINPSLLLLDEPTSGLDSTTALRTIQMLQDIAEAGKTVVTTIHQPSSRLFQKFDKLILLGKGSLLYFGKASEVMVYFSSIGCSPQIAMNPAEFLLDLANVNINFITLPREIEDKVQMGSLETGPPSRRPSPQDIHSYLVKACEMHIAEGEKKQPLDLIPFDEAFKSKVASVKRQWGASWWQQFSILFCRGIKERRHEYFSWLRITQVIATAVILGLLWWQSDSSTLKGRQDQAGLVFFIAVFWGFFPVFNAIFTFPQERAMLSKERAADMYRLSAYFVARTMSDLPLDLLLPLPFLLIVYFMAGLQSNASCFFLSLLTVFLCIVAAQGLGLAIGATLVDLKKAATLASVTVMTFMLSGGFFVEHVPIFMSWIRYVSFNYHTYKLLLKIQQGDATNSINGTTADNGRKEVTALATMVVGYRLLAYASLRRMYSGS